MIACALYPVVNGKPSSLYQELLEKTGKDRKLVNLLYAMSLQEDIKKLFNPSDLNSQGEPAFKAFIEKLGVEEIINEKANIASEARKLGALNDKNNIVYYDNPNDILDYVIDFNNHHDKMKARIRYSSDNGYYMEVDTINAENYNTNNILQVNAEIYKRFAQHLRSNGLNTDFSPEVAKGFNVVNIKSQIAFLSKIKNDTNKLSIATVEMLMELMSSHPWVDRLKSVFGDDTAKAISQVSGYYQEELLTINPDSQEKINFFLNAVRGKLKTVFNGGIVDTLIAEATASVTPGDTFMGTDGLSVKDTLNELYRSYHLDKESLDALQKKVTKVSDAANKIFAIRLARLNELRLKTGEDNKSERSKLERVQKQLDNAKYLDSIVKMLADISNYINDIETTISRRDKKLSENPQNLSVIESYSSFLMKQLDLVKSFKPILEELEFVKLLENDDEFGESSLLKDISETAEGLVKQLKKNEKLARKKLFEVVHAFLKIYWGEDTEEARQARGNNTTLKDIMDTASKDINFFDRFIYSAGTCSDEMMALIAEATKAARERRDKKLVVDLKDVRSITEELYKSGSSTKFMYELDDNGYPSKIISDHNYKKYEEDLQAYVDSLDEDLDKWEKEELKQEWIKEHTKTVTEFGISLKVPYYKKGGKNIYENDVKLKDRLTSTQYLYYTLMMQKRADMIDKIPPVLNSSLYDVIEISTSVTDAVAESGGNPMKVFEIIKNKFIDATQDREDDTEYTFATRLSAILEGNGMISANVDALGNPIQTLPINYTHKIKDRSRVSTDFSKSMMAFLATSTLYTEMNRIVDSLMLSKDYMLNRDVYQREGGKLMSDVSRIGKKAYVNLASKMGVATDLKGLADDFFERCVYGKAKKNEGYLFGSKVRIDKAVDLLTGYTSMAGLTVNALGAQANVLVGKLQMLIEAGGSEFFNMKDLTYADAKYFQMLGPLLNEINTEKKSSLLGLMMEKFDVSDDFFDKIKETGFYKQPISKIIGNKNLFFLYGMGEHLLHAQGMIAVLHNSKNKVLDEHGKERNLLDAFYVEKDKNGVGTLKVKDGWTLANGDLITEDYLDKIKGRIAYVNKSMHGAFGSMDKGMIHRYAIGRLIMNFRQWMPAHYSRRFRGRYYDTDLHEYREGYYVSTYKFLRDTVKDAYHHRFQIATRWNELSTGEKANLKRALAETAIFAILTGLLAIIGPAKDHKGNWAMRHLIYQLSRMRMETAASDPVALYGFVDNMMKLVQSPMACISTLEKLSNLLDVTDAFETIESGKYEGRNRYSRNLEKSLPFYGLILKMLDMGEEDDLFLLFN